MTIIEAVILGLIQGITEFLPVSSSGHLVIAQQLMGLSKGALTFDVVIHLGSLAAIMWLFRSELALIIKGITGAKTEEGRTGRRLLLLLIVATLPLVLVGLVARDLIDRAFSTIWVTPIMLYATGALLLIAERFPARLSTNHEKDISWQRALYIGALQVLAVLPGMSRSGITIVAGMTAGLNRELASRFSFLMAIPAIAGASVLELRSLMRAEDPGIAGPAALIIGTLVAAVSTYYAVVLFLRFVKNRRLTPFAYYTWILATIVLVAAWFGYIA